MEDQKIIELFWQRSELAVEQTAEKYGNYCHQIAWRVLYSQEDSEECVNDTWLRAWDAIPPQKPGKLSAFLGRITRNLALNRRERMQTEKRGGGQVHLALQELGECLLDRSGDPCDRILLTQLLNRFLSGLKPRSRNIFLRRYWFFCSVKEIAEFYSVSESRVKMTLLRTREQLKALLQKEDIQL